MFDDKRRSESSSERGVAMMKERRTNERQERRILFPLFAAIDKRN